MDERRTFLDYLASRGKRMTRERDAVFVEVFSSRDMLDLDQLVDRVSSRPDGRRVSRATVYRTLLDLVDAGLMRRVDECDGPIHFQRANRQ